MASNVRAVPNDPLRRAPDLAVLPVARDVFVQAPRQSNPGGNMEDLARALGSFSDSIGRYGAIANAVNRKNEQEQLAAFDAQPRQNRIQYAQNTPAPNGGESMFVWSGKRKRGAASMVAEEAEAIDKAIINGEYDPNRDGPIDQFVHSRVQARAKELGFVDQFAQQGINHALPAYMAQANRTWATQQNHLLIAENQTAVDDTIEKAYTRKVPQLVGEPTDTAGNAVVINREQTAEEKVAAVRQAASELRKHFGPYAAGLKGGPDGDYIDQSVASLSMRILKNNKDIEVSHKLLFDERKDEKGNPLPPIAAKKTMATTVKTWMSEAQKITAAKEIEEAREQLGAKHLANLYAGKAMVDMKPLEYTTVDGKKHTVSVKDQQEALWSNFKKKSEQQARALKETPEETSAREAGMIARSQLVNTQLKDKLSNLASRLTPDVLKELGSSTPSGQETRDEIFGLIRDWRALQAASPVAALKHVEDKQTRDLLDIATGLSEMGLAKDEGAALLMAHQAVDPTRSAETSNRLAPVFREINTKVDRSGYVNGEDYRREFQRAARMYAIAGVRLKDALTKAEQHVNNNGIKVNGYWVELPHGNNGAPLMDKDRFAQVLQHMTEKWHDENNADPEVTKSMLAVRPNPDGTWTLFNKVTGGMVQGKVTGDGGQSTGTFTRSDLLLVDRAMREGDNKTKIDDMVKQSRLQRQYQEQDFSSFLKTYREVYPLGDPAAEAVGAAYEYMKRKGFSMLDTVLDENRYKLYTYTDKKSGKTGLSLFSTPEELKAAGNTDVQKYDFKTGDTRAKAKTTDAIGGVKESIENQKFYLERRDRLRAAYLQGPEAYRKEVEKVREEALKRINK